MFTPYYNGDESHSIHDLTLENSEDCVNIYGNLQLTKDQAGLAAAKALQSYLNEIVKILEETADLPEQLNRPDADEIENPFL